MRSIARNSLINIFCTATDLFFSMITTAYVARVLLADGVGKVSYVQSIIVYFVTLAEFGISGYGIREIAKVRSRQNDISQMVAELFTINFITTTCSLIGYLSMIGCFAEGSTEIPLFLVCGISIFSNYFNVEWVYRGLEDYLYIAVKRLTVKLLFLFVIYACVQTENDHVKYALIAGLSGVVICVLDFCRLHRYVKMKFSKIMLSGHLKSLMILAVSNMLTNGYSRINITMLGSLSTEKATGYYTYAYTLVHMVMIISTSFTQVLFPRLSYFYVHDRRKFYELFDQAVKAIVFIVFPASAGIFILAPQIITVFLGSSFQPAVKTLRWLSVLIIIQGLADLWYQIVLSTGNERRRVWALGAAVIGNIMLARVFIPIWEDSGAALSFILSELGLNSYLICSMSHQFQFKIPWKEFKEALISTTVMAMAVSRIVKLNLTLFMLCVIAAVCGVMIYGGLNVLMKNETMKFLIDKRHFGGRKVGKHG